MGENRSHECKEVDAVLGSAVRGRLSLFRSLDRSLANLCQYTLHPFCDALSVRVSNHWCGWVSEDISDKICRPLAHFWSGIQAELEDCCECLADALYFDLGTVEGQQQRLINREL